MTIYGIDPVTGGRLEGECQPDGSVAWVVVHLNGVVEWIGDSRDQKDTMACLLAERDQLEAARRDR